MPALTLRLPQTMETRLEAEALFEGKARSEVVREALDKFLGEQEQGRFLGAMIQEMRSMPQVYRADGLQAAEEGLIQDNQSLERAERRKGSKASKSKASEGPWWR